MDHCKGFGNLTGLPEQTCALPTDIAILFVALNIGLSITASLGNILILVALHKVSSVYPPTKLLFRSLAVNDLCIGLITQPLNTIRLLDIITTISKNIVNPVNIAENTSSFILCAVSILTSTCISVDRLLALKLGLRYRHVVTLRRVRVAVILFWFIGISSGCVEAFWDPDIAFKTGIVSIILCVVISVFSYANIFITMSQHQPQVHGHTYQGQPHQGGIPLNIIRYKKTVSSIAWVQCSLAACYLPYVISALVITQNGWFGISSAIVWTSAMTLLYLNSSLNPILYCWKIRDVRQAVKNTVKQMFLFIGLSNTEQHVIRN